MHEGGAIFHIGSFGVTSTMTTMLGITIILLLICLAATKKLRTVEGADTETPTGLQNAMEWLVEFLDNFLADIIGNAKVARKYFPLMATLFIFILISNYSGLLPRAGHLPGLAAPTSSLSVTVALSLTVFISTFAFGFKEHGIKYLLHFFKPVALLFPLMLIDELIRPVSLSLRLYGNIYGEEMISQQFFQMFPLFLPLPMQFLSLLMGLIQALVFMILTSVYISEAVIDEHE